MPVFPEYSQSSGIHKIKADVMRAYIRIARIIADVKLLSLQ
jgi:hypothetical protein